MNPKRKSAKEKNESAASMEALKGTRVEASSGLILEDFSDQSLVERINAFVSEVKSRFIDNEISPSRALILIFLSAMTVGLGVFLVAGRMPTGMIVAGLIIGLCLVVLLGMFAFSLEDKAVKSTNFRPQEIMTAITEPAAIALGDGTLVGVNQAWLAAGGHKRRLPQGSEAPALFVAMAEARQHNLGRALVRLGFSDFEMVVTLLNSDMVLIRAATQAVLGAGLMIEKSELGIDGIQTEDFLSDELVAGTLLPSHESSAERSLSTNLTSQNQLVGLEDYAEAAPFGAALVSGDDLLTAPLAQVNARFGLMLGYSLEGRSLSEVLTSSSLDELSQSMTLGQKNPHDVQFQSRTQHFYALHLAKVTDGWRVYAFDITEQKKLEQTVAQSQKMQAMGQFAGGIAHDFNNLLTGFKLRNDQLLQMHPLGDPSYEDLNGIKQIIARAEDLVRNLLAYARKQTVKRVTLNVGELVSEAEVLLRRLVREDIKLVTNYGRNLPDVHVDKGQMEMVMMNLVVNARDAMKPVGGGTVTITTTALSQKDAVALGFTEAPMIGAAMIEVRDTGTGIPQDIINQVFEPFFTTKPQGEGTGLGLSTVFGIIHQSGGQIFIESPIGQGACFRIFLPAWIEKEKPQLAPKPPVEARQMPKDLAGVGRILFVEDEQIVRGLAAKLLRQRGYEVLEACDGEEALMIIENEQGRFDLLISDVIMPGLDGPSMLRKARPLLGDHVPVMFISGYAESEFSDLLEVEANVSFLPKPLDIKTLAERVKEQLAA